jgi:2-aminoadipate transaminase
MAEVQTHSTSPFFRALAEAPPDRPRVIYIPGDYCVHPDGDLAAQGRRQLRLSYGFESAATIVRALALMSEAARAA